MILHGDLSDAKVLLELSPKSMHSARNYEGVATQPQCATPSCEAQGDGNPNPPLDPPLSPPPPPYPTPPPTPLPPSYPPP